MRLAGGHSPCLCGSEACGGCKWPMSAVEISRRHTAAAASALEMRLGAQETPCQGSAAAHAPPALASEGALSGLCRKR